ncbi:hypothetical protein [Evansella tamaricis]|uniref:Uncharacterized protein n=1 Tax=Evansella tamaricis TaxID=2069301 RepID=A0ABS6JG85_9BACI|nr:hypothetical protein [Evansella tamaricis]MBU9712699.1 hypothetical protein [Evansella tamaricis]
MKFLIRTLVPIATGFTLYLIYPSWPLSILTSLIVGVVMYVYVKMKDHRAIMEDEINEK